MTEPAEPTELSHIGPDGTATMVDITAKDVTERRAAAQAVLTTRPEVVELIAEAGLPKGDALGVARIAGIMAAKKTSDLIPLCHPLPVSGVDIDFRITTDAVHITATVATTGRTGVEMEALSAATTAALTVYDMIKAVDRTAVIDQVQVVRKSGGRSGEWQRDDRND